MDAWWPGLPERLDRLAAGWGLGIGEPVGRGNTSLVLWCRRPDGARGVLKLSPDPALTDAEAGALRAWATSAVVPALWACDPGAGALLLEAIGDGTSLARRERAVGVDAVARIIGGLYAAGAPPGFPPLARLRRGRLGVPRGGARRVARARALAAAIGCGPDRMWRWCAAFAAMIAGSGEVPDDIAAALLSLSP
jgi:streptomycin 6-kinase